MADDPVLVALKQLVQKVRNVKKALATEFNVSAEVLNNEKQLRKYEASADYYLEQIQNGENVCNETQLQQLLGMK